MTDKNMTVTDQSGIEDKSFWQREYGQYEPNGFLSEKITADVTIIGAGFTGLTTAWQFKRDNPNARVVVLEAMIVGYGASGRNAGFSTKLFGLEPELVLLRWGKEKMIEAHSYMQNAVEYTRKIITDNNLNSDYEHTGLCRISYSDKQLKRMLHTFELFQKLGIGHDMHWMNKAQFQADFATDQIAGGVFESNTGMLNPCKQVRALKHLAERAGVEVYEMSPVARVEENSNSIQVHSGLGQVKTEKLVVAANAYARDVDAPGGIRNRQLPVWSYQIVTEPLPKAQWESIGWKERQTFGDNRQMLHYFRPTADGRIIMGGGDILFNRSMDSDFSPTTWRHCEQHLKWIYPQLEQVKIDYRWGGPVSTNLDFVPEIGFLGDERIIYSGGCFGHGVSLSHYNGRTIADLLNEQKTERTDFWIVNRKAYKLPGQTLSRIGARTVRQGLKAWDWWEERAIARDG